MKFLKGQYRFENNAENALSCVFFPWILFTIISNLATVQHIFELL